MTKHFFWAILGSLLFFSCSKETTIPIEENNPSTSINKIMPLGASRVEGARPDFESYRYELWKDLIDGGWTFDFVGTRGDEGVYPEYEGNTFDADHEGRGGWTSGQILEGINDWLNLASAPDIVLFSSPGGNDALQGLSYADALTNVRAIIATIQTANPNVTIVIEQLAPAHSSTMSPDLSIFLTQMQQDVVSLAVVQTTSTSQVIVVDMFTGFSDSLLADEVHYNEAGASFIANRYYETLVNFLK